MDSEKRYSDTISSSIDNDLQAIHTFIENFIEKHDMSADETFHLLSSIKDKQKVVSIPSYVLRYKSLGIIESVTKYLKEHMNLSYHQIALLLQRDDRVIWVTYNRAIKKISEKLTVDEPNIWLPISIFSKNENGPLETIATYLKDNLNMRFSEIARILNRDNRSVWASYNKVKKKYQNAENPE